MKRLFKLAPIALLAILALAPAASAQRWGGGFRGGFRGGFGGYYGGYYGGFYGPGYFGYYGPGPWVWGYWGAPYGLGYGPSVELRRRQDRDQNEGRLGLRRRRLHRQNR